MFIADGKPIGGTETILDVNGEGIFTLDGMFSLDGKQLQEISGKSFEEWKRDWLARTAGEVMRRRAV